jgi:uncharacterized NAD(P)/FAD-binding protein YdhS
MLALMPRCEPCDFRPHVVNPRGFIAAAKPVYECCWRDRGIGAEMSMGKAPFTLCVVGGGFTGAAIAIACLQRITSPFRLVMIEPSPQIGRGVAYGGHHPLHLLNVRARDLSIRASQPGDFLNWAFRQLDQGENQAGLHEALAHAFLPRQLFGEYVRQRLYESAAQRPEVAFSVVNDAAISCATESGRYRVDLARNASVIADVVFLATAYGLSAASAEGALKPFESVAPDRLSSARQIALIGSGLTMVDVLLAARRDGFQGSALVVSRRGQLPRPHAPKGVVPKEIGLPRSKRVSLLAAAIRISCEMAEESGTPWQAVINGLRPSLPDIWQALPANEQARFLRHLRPFWNSHRHRLPMEVHSRLMAEFAEGRAVLLHGSVRAVRRDADGFKLTVLSRGSRAPRVVAADLAFDCTGFRPDLHQPLIASLFKRDLARPDPHHLGLAVDRNGRVIGASGASFGLFAIGPLCQGTLWEITAVPEIVAQSNRAAQALAILREAEAETVQIRAAAYS